MRFQSIASYKESLLHFHHQDDLVGQFFWLSIITSALTFFIFSLSLFSFPHPNRHLYYHDYYYFSISLLSLSLPSGDKVWGEKSSSSTDWPIITMIWCSFCSLPSKWVHTDEYNYSSSVTLRLAYFVGTKGMLLRLLHSHSHHRHFHLFGQDRFFSPWLVNCRGTSKAKQCLSLSLSLSLSL